MGATFLLFRASCASRVGSDGASEAACVGGVGSRSASMVIVDRQTGADHGRPDQTQGQRRLTHN